MHAHIAQGRIALVITNVYNFNVQCYNNKQRLIGIESPVEEKKNYCDICDLIIIDQLMLFHLYAITQCLLTYQISNRFCVCLFLIRQTVFLSLVLVILPIMMNINLINDQHDVIHQCFKMPINTTDLDSYGIFSEKLYP